MCCAGAAEAQWPKDRKVSNMLGSTGARGSCQTETAERVLWEAAVKMLDPIPVCKSKEIWQCKSAEARG